eukprot:CAMPEP_0172638182 /NCGR_PEP_ID=MMETSP1068-20121228/212627_1 /TAXON_ID=35684 /ORGANISM="Pseudopedinella elastica, Strain CCMP716" /LENGTH=38 /DNA_ID= /DNA_START= /DNA_END= /DNA_ORIENTATION=
MKNMLNSEEIILLAIAAKFRQLKSNRTAAWRSGPYHVK